MKAEQLAYLIELLHANAFSDDSFKPMLDELLLLTNSSSAFMIAHMQGALQPANCAVSAGADHNTANHSTDNSTKLMDEYGHLLTQEPYYHDVTQFSHGQLFKLGTAVSKNIQPQCIMDYYRAMDAQYTRGVLIKTAQSNIVLVINRRAEQKDYTYQEEELLKALAPHLKLVVENRQHLSLLHNRMANISQALELSEQAIGIIGVTGKMLFYSTSFYNCLFKNNLLSLSGMEQCQLRSYRHNDWLESTLNKLYHYQNYHPQNRRLSNDPLIDLQVTLLNVLNSEPLFLLQLKTVATIPFWWQLVYSFTPKERLLIDKLLTGLTLPEAAEQLHVSHNTVRSHLHHILVKTQCNSQNQLLVTLLSSHQRYRD